MRHVARFDPASVKGWYRAASAVMRSTEHRHVQARGRFIYYRCLGSDGWRYLNGAVRNNPPIREDLLDQVVWNEVVKLLENPRLIEQELDRRLEAAQKASPTKRRQESLHRDLTRVHKSIERLMTAYQE